MIFELITFLRTRSNKAAKDWGYTYQNISLKFRASRCEKAWQSHVDASHTLIREELTRVQPKSVMIIGSGLLLEIPIQDLLAKTEKIILVDMVHAPEIRKLAAKNKKIQLIEKDITSLLGILKKDSDAMTLKTIQWEQLPKWDLPKVDWVISANLLSQISLIISESISMSTEVYNKFARHVRDQHIERLFSVGKEVLLFADFETYYTDTKGERIKTESYEVNLQSLKFVRDWMWQIAPYGEYSKDYKVEMLVKAYRS